MKTKYVVAGAIILIISCCLVTACIANAQQYQMTDTSYNDVNMAHAIFDAMNENRIMHNVAPLRWNNNLECAAYNQSLSYASYQVIAMSLPYDREDYMIVQSWELTNRISYPMFQVDKLSNTDRNFQLDQLNPDYHSAGVAAVTTNGMYYVVIKF
jgi:hypothetical protein